jgi:hypothetical protein
VKAKVPGGDQYAIGTGGCIFLETNCGAGGEHQQGGRLTAREASMVLSPIEHSRRDSIGSIKGSPGVLFAIP